MQDESKGLQPILALLQRMDTAVRQEHLSAVQQLPEISGLPRRQGPKFPSGHFNYLQALQQHDDQALDEHQLLGEVARFFRGAIRPQADNAVFNMVPEPSTEAAAAACLAVCYNPNGLMDAFGGEGLLVEQQVARTLGNWIDWPQAMGIACSGGKLTMFYALRCAISRLQPQTPRRGAPSDMVALCSEGAHYCVEHVASLTGLGADNCWRVATDDHGRLCTTALLATLERAHEQGKRVVAIICCGGTTINFNCDDTAAVATTVDDFVARHRLAYRPYLHLDSVIGWLYFSLAGHWGALAQELGVSEGTWHRLGQILGRFAGMASFDSFAVDFHKNGLCPYSSSFFVSRDRRFMDELGQGSYHYSERDFEFGNFRSYRYTLENSRSSQGVLSSWVNLKALGRKGYIQHLLGLYQSQGQLCRAMAAQPRLSVLNDQSLGWEVVFSIAFTPEVLTKVASHTDACMAFISHCWARVNQGYDVPLFSVVPDYRINNRADQVTTAFLLYPMRVMSQAQWRQVLEQILIMLEQFEQQVMGQADSLASVAMERPIR